MAICAGGGDAKLRIEPATDPTRVELFATLPEHILALLPAGKLAQEQGERRLRLALLDPESGLEGPAIFGRYERREMGLYFTPRYPLMPGQRYRATLLLDGNRNATVEYRAPARATTAVTVVERVYPTAAELPANQLKFYVHFSRPMRESKGIFDHLQLLDDRGKPIEDPWRRTELWSADAKRLTLWIHPGRIKEGVNLREQLGPVLEPERNYTLVIAGELPDVNGQPLGKPFIKKFCTTQPERTRPRVEDWKVLAPATGSREALVLKFPRPLDRALLDRFLRMVDARDQPIGGNIEVGPEERSWRFLPDRPWQANTYSVKVDGRLEDLAGNTPERLFDVDLEQAQATPPKLELSFHPRVPAARPNNLR